jgi:hypothetical protein
VGRSRRDIERVVRQRARRWGAEWEGAERVVSDSSGKGGKGRRAQESASRGECGGISGRE